MSHAIKTHDTEAIKPFLIAYDQSAKNMSYVRTHYPDDEANRIYCVQICAPKGTPAKNKYRPLYKLTDSEWDNIDLDQLIKPFTTNAYKAWGKYSCAQKTNTKHSVLAKAYDTHTSDTHIMVRMETKKSIKFVSVPVNEIVTFIQSNKTKSIHEMFNAPHV